MENRFAGTPELLVPIPPVVLPNDAGDAGRLPLVPLVVPPYDARKGEAFPTDRRAPEDAVPYPDEGTGPPLFDPLPADPIELIEEFDPRRCGVLPRGAAPLS